MGDKYWKDSLEIVFEEHNLVISDEIIEEIINIKEMESEYCGYHNIPNPLESEVEKLKQRIKNMENKYENQLYGVRKGFAEKYNVEARDVEITEEGEVYTWR
jgi:hypothetical protein